MITSPRPRTGRQSAPLYVNRIAFTRTDSRALGREPSTEAVQRLFGAWERYGRVCGREQPIVEESNGYSTVALSHDRDSLEPGFNSGYATERIAGAEAEGLHIARQVLGADQESSPACSCISSSGYAMFTRYLSLESPIRCMDCFRPVLLYRMKPMANGEFYELISWQPDFQSCDSLQMNCRVLKREATGEMSNIDSSLTTAGRAYCATLAASSGRPFYYYLYRSHGPSHRAELMRRCPGCGGEWGLATRLHRLFGFKCDCCRLLSNVAFDIREPEPPSGLLKHAA
jgi:predicted  nucleic acid-binding Zn ribbon protein